MYYENESVPFSLIGRLQIEEGEERRLPCPTGVHCVCSRASDIATGARTPRVKEPYQLSGTCLIRDVEVPGGERLHNLA